MQNQKGIANRWRKKGKRGVSPIIATILLVAITVVLAAVLYILISGLTKGPGNTPLGSALAMNTPVASAGGTTYTVNIVPASGLTPASMNFELTSSSGTILGTGTTVTVVGVTGCLIAVYTFSTNAWAAASGGTACAGASTTQVLTSGMQLSLVTSVSQSGLGDKLVAIGVGTFSGQVSATLP
ncbi:MAG TPA: archaellin/type IV pilin N-terminal domain-containing protein [Thermoplasmata archaeon]|jgi:flagellin-like protein|nr:archaellin/type IV pilin N-terminal domain-containing protein [Thermoplasmata archaeon]